MIRILRSQGSEGADTLLCTGQKGGGQFPNLQVSEVRIADGQDLSKNPPNRAGRIVCEVCTALCSEYAFRRPRTGITR